MEPLTLGIMENQAVKNMEHEMETILPQPHSRACHRAWSIGHKHVLISWQVCVARCVTLVVVIPLTFTASISFRPLSRNLCTTRSLNRKP